jgi:arsenite-transporting ATPase
VADARSFLSGLLSDPPRFLFFTGKGGVGKTTTAAATAVALADQGARVLLVSTDPASNLDEVLAVALGSSPSPVIDRLDAMNIDPVAAAASYRERVVGPYRGVLPQSAVASIEEQLSGACTVEIAAFDEFTSLLADPTATSAYDHVVFDTAPTGHTLRMLSLPGAWSEFLETNELGATCIGPLAGLSNQKERYRAAVTTLADGKQTLLVLVARPDVIALNEAARAARELGSLGIDNQRLVLNGVFHVKDREDPLAMALSLRSQQALDQLPAPLQALARDEVGLVPFSLVGLDGLRALVADAQQVPSAPSGTTHAQETIDLSALVDDLSERGHGLVLTMGKGGVGKTTMAAAIAVELARRGHVVELTTTDPADHLGAVVGDQDDGFDGRLRVGRIDPAVVTNAYAQEVLSRAGEGLQADALEVLKEDLRSPCTEEIAVFKEFARIVGQANDHFVVLDTAPTGHTILLLDSAESYHRDVTRQSAGSVDPAVRQLLGRLQDPQYTSIFIVALGEATPVHEAGALQRDLLRAGITPTAWIINQSLLAAGVTDPVLRARADQEVPILNEVQQDLSQHVALVPMLADPPTGVDGLVRLLEHSVSLGVNTPAYNSLLSNHR